MLCNLFMKHFYVAKTVTVSLKKLNNAIARIDLIDYD